ESEARRVLVLDQEAGAILLVAVDQRQARAAEEAAARAHLAHVEPARAERARHLPLLRGEPEVPLAVGAEIEASPRAPGGIVEIESGRALAAEAEGGPHLPVGRAQDELLGLDDRLPRF